MGLPRGRVSSRWQTANEPTALETPLFFAGQVALIGLFCLPIQRTPELRRQYFVRMHPAFADLNLDEAVEESAGFSFAQLREDVYYGRPSSFQ